jgi:hypothetical protein
VFAVLHAHNSDKATLRRVESQMNNPKIYIGDAEAEDRPWVRLSKRLLVAHRELGAESIDTENMARAAVYATAIALDSAGGDFQSYNDSFPDGVPTFPSALRCLDDGEALAVRLNFVRGLFWEDLTKLSKQATALWAGTREEASQTKGKPDKSSDSSADPKPESSTV